MSLNVTDKIHFTRAFDTDNEVIVGIELLTDDGGTWEGQVINKDQAIMIISHLIEQFKISDSELNK